MIVKVQVSITTTHAKRQVLVYDKARSLHQQFDADPPFDTFPLKSYWKAHINKRSELVLDMMVSGRDW
jgi:hypothetical protein